MNAKKRKQQIFYLILSYGVWGLFWGGWGVLLPAIKTMIGISDGMLGTALLGITIGAILSMLGTGWIVKKFNKWALCGTLIYFAGAIAALTVVDSVITLGLVLFFVGSASGMLDVIMNSGIATLESLTGKHYFNYAHAAFPIAVIITSPTVGWARQSGIEVEIILLVMAAIVAGVGVLSLALDMSGANKEEVSQQQSTGGSKILVTKIILILGMMGLVVHLMENAVEQWSAIYLEQSLSSAPTIASLGLTGYMGMLFVGRMLAQKFNEFFTQRKILSLSTIVIVIGFLLVIITENPIVVIIGFSLAGLGIAPIIPIVFSLTGQSVAPEKKVKAISSVTVIAYTGYLISPPLVGAISTIFNLKVAWVLLTTVAGLLLILVRLIANFLDNAEYEEVKTSAESNKGLSKEVVES